MTDPGCVVIGAGISGATCAWYLQRNPYEPNGAHIFHTSDEEVWNVASSLIQFAPYNHRVKTRVDGKVL